MELTKFQQEMLDGKFGKGKAMALQIQVAVGESFEAERMIPVSRVHVALSAQEADIWFAGKLLMAGASCSIPPTVNPGYCVKYFKDHGMLGPEGIQNMEKTHNIYKNLGAVLTYSCTPYLFGNIPHYGEVLAFSETSATIYANSVIGARTNRESAASALCAAITGYVPECGMLINENRYGNILVEVEAEMKTDFDYACLGLLGKKIGRGIPVFTGLPKHISAEALINLGTQLNVSGSYEMFHIEGITPEAGTIEMAFGYNEIKRRVVITKRDMEEELQKFSPPVYDDVHFVMLGCPHYTYEQLVHVNLCLNEEKAAIPVWILTSSQVESLACSTGLKECLKQKGIEIVPDTCIDQSYCWGHLSGLPGVTDSPKCSYYMSSFGVPVSVADTDTCIKWAKIRKGMVNGKNIRLP